MKILMLTDRLALGGAETHIYELIKGLCAQGKTVEIASAGGAYAEKLRHEGIRHYQINWATRNPFSLLAARRQLTSLLRQGGYTLVHAHARLPAYLAAPLCRQLNIPLVTTAHWVFRADGWRGRLSRWGDHTLAVSEDIGRYLTDSYGIPPHRITLTRNGINTTRFSPSKASGNGCRLIHVSRLDEGRAAAAAALIRLAPQLFAHGATSLTVVGGGNCLPRLTEEAEAANRVLGRPFIRMTGPAANVAPLLRENDIFIGVSRAALEAMACGLAVVLAGDEGYLSVFSPAVAKRAEGSNFCCRGADALTDERLLADLVSLLKDDRWRRELGAYGTEYVRRHYSAAAMVADADRAYRRLLAERRRPPIIICGYYGFYNLGDEAVLSDLLLRLRREGFTRITVLSARPAETSRQHRVSAVARLSWAAIRRAGMEGGIFLLGGGNLLQNETSRRSLFYYTQCMRFAKQCGCRVFVLGGIGRLDPHGERVVSHALQYTDACLGRTPQDVAYFHRLHAASHTKLLPDGALWTPPAPFLPANLPSDSVLLLALHGSTPDSMATALIDACAAIARHDGLSLVFACMHTGQDPPLARQGCLRASGAQILPPLCAEETVAFLASRCRLVVATRLHMLIFAAAAGVPAITVEDGGKISAFAAYAAACDAEPDAPMLTCLPKAHADTPLPIIQKALAAPRSAERCRRFRDALRSPGENFSFAACFEEHR